MTYTEKEKRWLVVVQNGDHVTLGRHTDPSEAEIDEVVKQLENMGTSGWLVVSEGLYYGEGVVSLLNVRCLTKIVGDWALAEENWRAKRNAANILS